MRLSGDQLTPSQVVLVNGRTVLADIKELDTTEGWVDIFFPVILEPKVVHEKATDEEEATEATGIDYEIRRLTGKVTIKVLD